MRDALSLLDQAIAYAGKYVTLETVQQMLGLADPHLIQRIVQAIVQVDRPAGLHLIHHLMQAGADVRQVNTQIAEYLRAMLLAREGANLATILDRTQEELDEIQQMARLIPLQALTACVRFFAHNDLFQSPLRIPQLALEIALLSSIACCSRFQGVHSRPSEAALSDLEVGSPPLISTGVVVSGKQTVLVPAAPLKQADPSRARPLFHRKPRFCDL